MAKEKAFHERFVRSRKKILDKYNGSPYYIINMDDGFAYSGRTRQTIGQALFTIPEDREAPVEVEDFTDYVNVTIPIEGGTFVDNLSAMYNSVALSQLGNWTRVRSEGAVDEGSEGTQADIQPITVRGERFGRINARQWADLFNRYSFTTNAPEPERNSDSSDEGNAVSQTETDD